MKIARIATVPFFLQNHLREQIVATIAAGHEVHLIASAGPEVALLQAIPGARFHCIDIPRKISLLRDLRALWQLFRLFRHERYDIVHSTTPKAGMLSALAALLARIPLRLHTFTGQPWVEMRGLRRFLAKSGDRVTAALDTQCYADSYSQRDFILAEQIGRPEKISVLASGSLAGVNLQRFDPARWAPRRNEIRSALGIAPADTVITFIGRLTPDKGLEELVQAFLALRGEGRQCVLLLVGPRELEWEGLSAATRAAIASNPAIINTGYSAEPERYLAASDIFCLPSYREGFGNVVIEAAAMGVVAVGTDIVGLRDAIVDGQTGVLVPPKRTLALVQALAELVADADRRNMLGRQARARAVAEFDAQKINAAVVMEYQRLHAASTGRGQRAASSGK
ncbi:MAG TPA: glycosyltransferase family 4 protein [Gallionellaceae bacterium]|nr:glycosyltransferase family 4 protein [Gallionellaceae bacterium]